MSVEQLSPLQLAMPEQFVERLSDMALSMYAVLVDGEKGKSVDEMGAAARLAIRLVVQLCQDFGGRSFYMHKSPLAAVYAQAARDKAIADAFNGRNILDLARQHGLTEMRIRQIVNQQHQREKSVKLSPQQIAERNKAIVAKFNGRNHKALASQAGLSVQQIRKIVADSKSDTNQSTAAFNTYWR